MDNRLFSDRIDRLKSLDYSFAVGARDNDTIVFGMGSPSVDSIDRKTIEMSMKDVMNDEAFSKTTLQYGDIQGLRSLREKISDRYNSKFNLGLSADNIFITNGSQECFDILCKTFLCHDDTILTENPGYVGALQSFSMYTSNIMGIEINDNGPDICSLECALRKQPKIFYGVPNNQNPSGISYSYNIRKAVAEALIDKNCIFMEDDAYGELTYDGNAEPPIFSMTDNSILIGSFSKTISPGARMGWIVAPEVLKESIGLVLEATCIHANSLSQAIINRFLELKDYDRHIEGIKKEYRKKRDTMLDAITDNFNGKRLSWNRPAGGMFIWMTAEKGVDMKKICDCANRKKLIITHGKAFHVTGGENTVRLNFTYENEENIQEGIKRLKQAYDECL